MYRINCLFQNETNQMSSHVLHLREPMYNAAECNDYLSVVVY